MPKRALVIGGYGNFGSYIAKELSTETNIQLIIAGRSKQKADAFKATLSAANEVETTSLDIKKDFHNQLENLQADIVIHTSGPFQGQSHQVAEACVKHGCHYIDLADAREYVCGISILNEQALNKGLLLVSGASSIPGLSSAIIDHYLNNFSSLDKVEYGISTAQSTNRGTATTAAILTYTGKPFKALTHGKMQTIYGWQSLHKRYFTGLGKRFQGNCDVPDLSLFPNRYPTLNTQRFYAGQELGILHIGLWLLSWLARYKLLPNLKNYAGFLQKVSFLFDLFGSDKSGFYMDMCGLDKAGIQQSIQFNLVARSAHGPLIPCMPAILLTKKIADGSIKTRGAMPCLGLITLKEYLNSLKKLDITWETSGIEKGGTL